MAAPLRNRDDMDNLKELILNICTDWQHFLSYLELDLVGRTVDLLAALVRVPELLAAVVSLLLAVPCLVFGLILRLRV